MKIEENILFRPNGHYKKIGLFWPIYIKGSLKMIAITYNFMRQRKKYTLPIQLSFKTLEISIKNLSIWAVLISRVIKSIRNTSKKKKRRQKTKSSLRALLLIKSAHLLLIKNPKSHSYEKKQITHVTRRILSNLLHSSHANRFTLSSLTLYLNRIDILALNIHWFAPLTQISFSSHRSKANFKWGVRVVSAFNLFNRFEY